MLNDKSEAIREKASECFKKLRTSQFLSGLDTTSIETFINLLDNKDINVKTMAIKKLGNEKATLAVVPLINMLDTNKCIQIVNELWEN